MSSLPPFVSVVIPTLRRPKLLLRALGSVFAQTYQQFEVIVVVDGPDDDSVAALRSVHDPRLQFFVNERSLTAAGARNFGVSQSKGEWIAFLDDDDEWLPLKLERQMSMIRSPSPVLVTCLSQVITPLASYVWPREIFDNSVLWTTIFSTGSPYLPGRASSKPRAICYPARFARNCRSELIRHTTIGIFCCACPRNWAFGSRWCRKSWSRCI